VWLLVKSTSDGRADGAAARWRAAVAPRRLTGGTTTAAAAAAATDGDRACG